MLVRELFFKLGFDSNRAEARIKAADRGFATLTRTIYGVAAAAGAAAVAAGTFISRAADDYQNLESRLKLVTDGQRELTAAQKETYDIAQLTRTAYEGVADLYIRMARPARRLGYAQRDILQVTENIQKAMKISGGDPASQAAALFQLGQGLQSGTLRGEELNSVLEQAPRLAEMIAEGMGIPFDRLRDLAADGQVTSQAIFESLLKQTDKINSEFSQIRRTGKDAWRQYQEHAFPHDG